MVSYSVSQARQGSLFEIWIRSFFRIQLQPFCKAVQYLKTEGLPRLEITDDRPAEYYYANWYAEAVHRILHDEPEDLLAFFMGLNYKQLVYADMRRRTHFNKLTEARKTNKELTAEEKRLRNALEKETKKNQRLTHDMDSLKHSVSYRIGRLITWIPRHIWAIF